MKMLQMQKEVYSRALRGAVRLFFDGMPLAQCKRLLYVLMVKGKHGHSDADAAALPLFYIRLRHLLKLLPGLLATGVASEPLLPAQQEAGRVVYAGVLSRKARRSPGNWLKNFLTAQEAVRFARVLAGSMAGTAAFSRVPNSVVRLQQLDMLLEACWLIHHSHTNSQPLQIRSFQLTGPLDLSAEERQDPFSVVTDFFSGWTILAAQKLLKNWFKAAISPAFCLHGQSAAALLLFHNEFTRLLEVGSICFRAGRLAVSPTANAGVVQPFLTAEADEHEICALRFRPLSADEQARLAALFTENNIRRLRVGMNHWLLAALSQAASVLEHDEVFLYPQFECMETILLGFYRLLFADADHKETQA